MNTAHLGTNFDDFLAENGILDEVNALATKKLLAYQLENALKSQALTKTTLAKRLNTSRAALNRLFDPNDTSMTLHSLSRAATALNCRIRVELELHA